MKFTLITFRYSVDGDLGSTGGPDALLRAGLAEWLREEGHDVAALLHVKLSPSEENAYGSWNRIGLANGSLAKLVQETTKARAFPLLLASNCYAAPGALAGLQISQGEKPPRVGMVWIDAHGDCNTPETTLSGMLSGMPVAIAMGLCLHRFREQAGLNPPIAAEDIVMVCVRANDPLEQELIKQAGIEIVPVNDLRSEQRQLRTAMNRLNSSVDAIYVHFDADALDQSEVSGMRLSEPYGPTRAELGGALRMIMAYPKIAALGIADINPERDVGGQIILSTLAVVRDSISGLTASRQ